MEHFNFTELTLNECQKISGGDGLTEAVFWFVGTFFRAQQRELDGLGGPTAKHY